MRPAHLLPLALALLLPLGARAEEAAPKAHVPFVEGKPFAEVLEQARREKKPILLDMYATWCGPCKMMDRTTFTDAGVIAWVKSHVVPARVDAEKGEGRKLSGRYAVSSFPTLIFLNADGSEIDRLLGAHPAGEFERLSEQLLDGKGPLAAALAELKTGWSMDTAMNVVQALGQRNDLARLRPVALRVVNDDPDLTDPRTLGALAVLVALEDWAGSLSPEVADLVETYLPKIGADPRRPLFAVALARELARRGDVAALRAKVPALAATLPKEGFLADLWVALGDAERKAGNAEAALAAHRKALEIAQEVNAMPVALAARHLDVAESLLAAKKGNDARAAVLKALEVSASEPVILARAAEVQLKAGQPEPALKNARRAVELSNGEDAAAQAALARALAASGDGKGARAAWSRAHRIDPKNPEYGKPLAAVKRGATSEPPPPPAGSSAS